MSLQSALKAGSAAPHRKSSQPKSWQCRHIGAYHEVEGTVLMTSADGTLSGFFSANGKFGEDFTSYGAKAGIRKDF